GLATEPRRDYGRIEDGGTGGDGARPQSPEAGEETRRRRETVSKTDEGGHPPVRGGRLSRTHRPDGANRRGSHRIPATARLSRSAHEAKRYRGPRNGRDGA